MERSGRGVLGGVDDDARQADGVGEYFLVTGDDEVGPVDAALMLRSAPSQPRSVVDGPAVYCIVLP